MSLKHWQRLPLCAYEALAYFCIWLTRSILCNGMLQVVVRISRADAVRDQGSRYGKEYFKVQEKEKGTWHGLDARGACLGPAKWGPLPWLQRVRTGMRRRRNLNLKTSPRAPPAN